MLQHLEMNSISQGRKAMKNLHRDGDVYIKGEKEIHKLPVAVLNGLLQHGSCRMFSAD